MSMHIRIKRPINALALAMMAAILVAGSSELSADPPPLPDPVIFGSVRWGWAVVRGVAEEMHRRNELPQPIRINSWGMRRNFERFAEAEFGCQVLYYNAFPTAQEAALLGERWPEGGPQPEAFVMGQARVAVIVHRSNPLRQITTRQIQGLLKINDNIETWRQLGGEGGAAIELYSDPLNGATRFILRPTCMALEPDHPSGHTGFYRYRDSFIALENPDAVLDKVRSGRNAIGFLLYTGQPLHGVKALPVAASDDGPAIALKEGAFVQDNYPVAEKLILFLRPGAPEVARAFCEFAISPEGSAIAQSHGLVSMRQHAESLASERLAEVRAGRGEPVSLMGVGLDRTLAPALASEYTRAKEAVRLAYTPAPDDVSALGSFTGGGEGARELLLLEGRPSARALERHGERFNGLGPEGAGPQEYMVAGRAAAVVVNAANALDALTLGQVQAIFGGETSDWSAVGGSGLAPDAGARSIPIARYGLRRADPAARVFHATAGAPRRGAVDLRATTAEVLAAVSLDPRAIGFVDACAIPAEGQTVKILSIRTGQGDHALSTRPTPETIRTATYPLAERLYLYVHPQSSDTAKNFAQFLSTTGASEATPYTDPVKAVIDTWQTHNLYPLTDNAIRRLTQDAEKAAQARAAGQ